MARKLDINTKEIILNAAEQIIAKEGKKTFSLRDISKVANISLGTLYYYYKSRDDIVIDLATLYLEGLNKEYFAWLKRHENNLSPDRFFDIIFLKGPELFDRGKIHLFLLNECIGGNKELQNKFVDLYKEWKENLTIGIKQVFPSINDVDIFSSILMMIIDGMIFQKLIDINDDDKNIKIKEFLKGFAK